MSYGESFSEKESLEEHELSKHGKELLCNFCSKSFEQKNDLMMHKKEKHEEKVSARWKHTLEIRIVGSFTILEI